MNAQEILKALDEGSRPFTRLLIGTGEDDWIYIAIDVEDLRRELNETLVNKTLPCTLSPYKSALWFEISGAWDEM